MDSAYPYDVLVVGAGLFGAVVAERLAARGCRVLVIERRGHIAGNAYTEDVGGIAVHRYGPHIFHTGSEDVWAYVNRFDRFNRFVNAPLALSGGRLYNLPFNMNTFHALWGTVTPAQARARVEAQRAAYAGRTPRNLEEQALAMVGPDVYETLIKGYTEKQWGRPCRDLPASIIRRIPLRFTYDNNYFEDAHQGIPQRGYTALVESLLASAEVRLDTDFLQNRELFLSMAPKVVYTGAIDAFFGYALGPLAYRSLAFEEERLDMDNYQGNAVVNHVDADVPFTRVIEHKHFVFGTQPHTVITREYPCAWRVGGEAFYPVEDEANRRLYLRYREMAAGVPGVVFGGRLGLYRYYNMDQVIESALACAEELAGHGC